MAADSALLLSLVEEYVSGLQDSKAGDTAAGKLDFVDPREHFVIRPVWQKSLWRCFAAA